VKAYFEACRSPRLAMLYELNTRPSQQLTAQTDRSAASSWVRVLRRITRWSSRITRWLQDTMVHGWDWLEGVAKLRPLMRAYLR
jgi:hypothetical protein